METYLGWQYPIEPWIKHCEVSLSSYLAIFNLEVVDTLEVVKSSPSHAGLENGKSDGTQNNILIKHPRTKKHREIKKHRRRRRSAKTRRKIESKQKPYLRASGPGRHRGFPQLGESETKRGSVGLLTINGWLYSLKFGPFGQRWLDLVVANGWAEKKPKDKDKNLVEGKDWHPDSEKVAASIMLFFLIWTRPYECPFVVGVE